MPTPNPCLDDGQLRKMRNNSILRLGSARCRMCVMRKPAAIGTTTTQSTPASSRLWHVTAALRPPNFISPTIAQRNNHAHSLRQFSSQASDPTAKRPTKVCDPYGQGGKPLSIADSSGLMSTLDEGWILEEQATCAKDNNTTTEPNTSVPCSVYKEFYHDNFMTGSRFVSQIAAVAHNNNHYPAITLERRLMKREKAWRVITVVKCFTPTLDGLSYNDFHLAMLVDVEVARPEVADLILGGDESSKKHT